MIIYYTLYLTTHLSTPVYVANKKDVAITTFLIYRLEQKHVMREKWRL